MSSRLSVVVTTHLRDPMLREALASIAAQTRPVHEVIVVDDGGPGSARAIVEAFGGRFSCIWQPNAGAQQARNRGMAASCGEWIAFLDDDDLWEPDRHALLAPLLDDESVDLISCDFRKFGPGTRGDATGFERFLPALAARADARREGPYLWLGRLPPAAIFPENPFWPSTLAIRRRTAEQVGPWNEAMRGVKAEDNEYLYRALRIARLALVLRPTVRYRVHPDNDSNDTMKVALGRATVLEHLIERVARPGPERDALLALRPALLGEAHWSAFRLGDDERVLSLASVLGACALGLRGIARTAVSALRRVLRAVTAAD